MFTEVKLERLLCTWLQRFQAFTVCLLKTNEHNSGNEIECAQMLLKSGAQPNVTQTDGQTPLHIAAKSGNVEMVKLLLREGANPRLRSNVSSDLAIQNYVTK